MSRRDSSHSGGGGWRSRGAARCRHTWCFTTARSPRSRIAGRHPRMRWRPFPGWDRPSSNATGSRSWPRSGTAPRTRPGCCRQVAMRLLPKRLPVHLGGSNFDGATVARCWDTGSHLYGRIEVVGLKDEPTPHGLLGSDERAVGGQGLAVMDAYGGRGLGKAHRLAGRDPRHLIDPLVVGVDLLLLLLGERGLLLERSALINQHDVLHCFSS